MLSSDFVERFEQVSPPKVKKVQWTFDSEAENKCGALVTLTLLHFGKANEFALHSTYVTP